MQYKPGASHYAPDFLSRTDNDAAVEDINDDIPRLALAETANGLLTGRYTGTDMPAPVEYDDIVEAQQTDAFRVELAERVAHKTAKAFFQNEIHGLYRRAPYGDQIGHPGKPTRAYPYAGTSRNGVSPPRYEPDVLRHAASVLLAIHGHGYLQHDYQVYHLRQKSAVTTTTPVSTDAVPSYGTTDRPIGRYLRANPRYQSW